MGRLDVLLTVIAEARQDRELRRDLEPAVAEQRHGADVLGRGAEIVHRDRRQLGNIEVGDRAGRGGVQPEGRAHQHPLQGGRRRRHIGLGGVHIVPNAPGVVGADQAAQALAGIGQAELLREHLVFFVQDAEGVGDGAVVAIIAAEIFNPAPGGDAGQVEPVRQPVVRLQREDVGGAVTVIGKVAPGDPVVEGVGDVGAGIAIDIAAHTFVVGPDQSRGQVGQGVRREQQLAPDRRGVGRVLVLLAGGVVDEAVGLAVFDGQAEGQLICDDRPAAGEGQAAFPGVGDHGARPAAPGPGGLGGADHHRPGQGVAPLQGRLRPPQDFHLGHVPHVQRAIVEGAFGDGGAVHIDRGQAAAAAAGDAGVADPADGEARAAIGGGDIGRAGDDVEEGLDGLLFDLARIDDGHAGHGVLQAAVGLFAGDDHFAKLGRVIGPSDSAAKPKSQSANRPSHTRHAAHPNKNGSQLPFLIMRVNLKTMLWGRLRPCVAMGSAHDEPHDAHRPHSHRRPI